MEGNNVTNEMCVQNNNKHQRNTTIIIQLMRRALPELARRILVSMLSITINECLYDIMISSMISIIIMIMIMIMIMNIIIIIIVIVISVITRMELKL